MFKRTILTCALLMLYLMSTARAQNPHSLKAIEQTGHAAHSDKSVDSIHKLYEHVIGGAHVAEIRQLTNRSEHRRLLEEKEVQEGSTGTDLILASAFNTWLTYIGGPQELALSTASVHKHRIVMSRIAPHLVQNSGSGQPSGVSLPSERLYLLDLMIAAGGVPPMHDSRYPDGAAKQQEKYETFHAQYAQAMAQYYKSTKPKKRLDDIEDILHAAKLDARALTGK